MFTQLCKQHLPIVLFRQPIFTSKIYNHVVTYDHASADDSLQIFKNTFFTEHFRTTASVYSTKKWMNSWKENMQTMLNYINLKKIGLKFRLLGIPYGFLMFSWVEKGWLETNELIKQ